MTMRRRRSTSPATAMITGRPRRRSRGGWLGAGVLSLIACACQPESETVFEYADYEGEAFPDRAADIAYPDRAVGLVTNSLSDSVSVVDLSTGSVIAERPVGRNPVDIDGPHHIVVDGDREFAYIALSYPVATAQGPHAIHGSSVQPGWVQKLSLGDLSVVAQVRVDPSPGEIVVSPDGSLVITSHFDLLRATQNPDDIEAARATIAIIETASMAMLGSPPARFVPVCVAPHGMVISPDGGALYVACYGEDRIAVVNLGDLDAAVEYVDVGPGVSGFGSPSFGPYALRFVDDATMAVSNTVSKDVRFFSTSSGAFDAAQTLTTLGAPYFPGVLPDGRLAIPTQQPDALYVIDLTGAVETEVYNFGNECPLPHVVSAVGPDVAVVCEGDKQGNGSLAVLGPDFDVAATLPLGVYPDSLLPLEVPR